MAEMSPERLSSANAEKVVDVVVANLDAHPGLVEQLTALPRQAVVDVQQQLRSATTQPPQATTDSGFTAAPSTASTDTRVDDDPLAEGANLLEGLTTYVLTVLDADELAEGRAKELADWAKRFDGKGVAEVVGLAEFKMMLKSWRREAVLRAERAAEARSPTLEQLTDLGEPAVIRGEVDMGDIKAATDGVLWTRALGGCVGVVIHSPGRSFLAHYTPDLLSIRGKPCPLDRTIELVGSRVTLKGARLWMSSPAQGVSYYENLKNRLTDAGIQLQTEYTSSRIALDIGKGRVHTVFKSLGGAKAHTVG
jgi:hypothetical protein